MQLSEQLEKKVNKFLKKLQHSNRDNTMPRLFYENTDELAKKSYGQLKEIPEEYWSEIKLEISLNKLKYTKLETNDIPELNEEFAKNEKPTEEDFNNYLTNKLGRILILSSNSDRDAAINKVQHPDSYYANIEAKERIENIINSYLPDDFVNFDPVKVTEDIIKMYASLSNTSLNLAVESVQYEKLNEAITDILKDRKEGFPKVEVDELNGNFSYSYRPVLNDFFDVILEGLERLNIVRQEQTELVNQLGNEVKKIYDLRGYFRDDPKLSKLFQKGMGYKSMESPFMFYNKKDSYKFKSLGRQLSKYFPNSNKVYSQLKKLDENEIKHVSYGIILAKELGVPLIEGIKIASLDAIFMSGAKEKKPLVQTIRKNKLPYELLISITKNKFDNNEVIRFMNGQNLNVYFPDNNMFTRGKMIMSLFIDDYKSFMNIKRKKKLN